MTQNDNHSFDAIAVICGDGRLTRTIGAQLKELLEQARDKVISRYPNIEVVLVYISLKNIGDRKFDTKIEVIS